MCRLLISLGALAFVGCAGPRVIPQFVTPSTVPIHQSAKQVEQHIEEAQGIVNQIEQQVPQAKPFIAALNKGLFDARTEIRVLDGQVLQLDTQLKTETDRANGIAADYVTSQATITTQKSEIAGLTKHVNKLKLYIIAVVAALGVLIAWKAKPLLILAGPYGVIGGFVGIPALISGFLWFYL